MLKEKKDCDGKREGPYMNTDKKSILLYIDSLPQLELLSEAACGRILLALLRYSKTGEMPSNMKGAEAMAFGFIRAQVDRDWEKYEEVCRVNRENGRKGGRPPRNGKKTGREEEKEALPAEDPGPEEPTADETAQITERLLAKPKKPDNDTDNETETDTETDTDKETGTQPRLAAQALPGGCAQKDALPRVFPYEEYRAVFVRECPSLPTPKEASQWRKSRKRALRKLNVSLEEFREVCKKVEASDFLTGRSGRWEGCSLDWLLEPMNWQKTSEGNYNRASPPDREEADRPSFDLEEYERTTLEAWEGTAWNRPSPTGM
jgi:hypothetical protein